MSLSIRIVNDNDELNTDEYLAAKDLRDMLKESIPSSVNGEILIAHSLTLVGQDPRDVDLLLVGKLNNCILPDYYTNDPQYKKKALSVDSFCIAIELKKHNYNDVRKNGTNIEIRYKDYWKPATTQNENQRYSVLNYFTNAFGYRIWVSNFLWLKSLSKYQIEQLKDRNPIGALPSKFTFNDIVGMIISQGVKVSYDNLGDKIYHIRVTDDSEEFMRDFKKLFATPKKAPTGLTRKKLDILIQKKAQNSLEKLPLGKKLSVFTGKAGTGKTFNLIQAALQLANPDTGDRCLLLTYNHALVSDVRRLLHFMEIPDGIDNYTIQIQTLHSFFIGLMKTLGINTDSIFGKKFEREYEKGLQELRETVISLMDEIDVKTLKEDNDQAIDWDFILIDEGQDWCDAEKDILYKIYGSNRLIIADGEDQFIRSANKQVWQKNISDAVVDKQKKGLRQKANLSEFVNALAKELKLDWEVKPNSIDEWSGGQVYIWNNYSANRHKAIEEYNKVSGCDNYDILFLVPPEMVDNENDHFKNLSAWEAKGIHLFDGTNDKLRQSYPTDINQCRLYQYDSCRGLEGWITICLHFDELIKYKIKEAQTAGANSLQLVSQEETLKQFGYLWSLMPLTRPIDTLCITLKDPKSEIAQILKKVAENHSEFVHWDVKE